MNNLSLGEQLSTALKEAGKIQIMNKELEDLNIQDNLKELDKNIAKLKEINKEILNPPMNKFKYLKDSTNEILGNIDWNNKNFKDEPVDIEDLGCFNVELITKEDMSDVWRVYIDGISPTAYYLKSYIKTELFVKYGIEAEIVTDW